MKPSHYELLGIQDTEYDPKAINEARERVINIWHFDKSQHWAQADQWEFCKQVCLRAQEAYETLIDKNKRAKYNEQLQIAKLAPQNNAFYKQWIELKAIYAKYLQRQNDPDLQNKHLQGLLNEELKKHQEDNENAEARIRRLEVTTHEAELKAAEAEQEAHRLQRELVSLRSQMQRLQTANDALLKATVSAPPPQPSQPSAPSVKQTFFGSVPAFKHPNSPTGRVHTISLSSGLTPAQMAIEMILGQSHVPYRDIEESNGTRFYIWKIQLFLQTQNNIDPAIEIAHTLMAIEKLINASLDNRKKIEMTLMVIMNPLKSELFSAITPQWLRDVITKALPFNAPIHIEIKMDKKYFDDFLFPHLNKELAKGQTLTSFFQGILPPAPSQFSAATLPKQPAAAKSPSSAETSNQSSALTPEQIAIDMLFADRNDRKPIIDSQNNIEYTSWEIPLPGHLDKAKTIAIVLREIPGILNDPFSPIKNIVIALRSLNSTNSLATLTHDLLKKLIDDFITEYKRRPAIKISMKLSFFNNHIEPHLNKKLAPGQSLEDFFKPILPVPTASVPRFRGQ